MQWRDVFISFSWSNTKLINSSHYKELLKPLRRANVPLKRALSLSALDLGDLSLAERPETHFHLANRWELHNNIKVYIGFNYTKQYSYQRHIFKCVHYKNAHSLTIQLLTQSVSTLNLLLNRIFPHIFMYNSNASQYWHCAAIYLSLCLCWMYLLCGQFRRLNQVLEYYSMLEILVSVPVSLWAASSRGQQQLSLTALLTLCALCTSQQRYHYLTHVPIEDVSFIGPLGQVEGYRNGKLLVRHKNIWDMNFSSIFKLILLFPLLCLYLQKPILLLRPGSV